MIDKNTTSTVTPIKPAKAQPTHRKLIERVLQANSVNAMMGWAALGQEYSGDNSAPSGADYVNASAVVSKLLYDVCGDLETLADKYEKALEQEAAA